MGRWKPHGTDRLAEAALELFAARGFQRTTVADIAARAELTERTFFRHFADKREVLFRGADALQEHVLEAVAAAPADASAMQAAAAGIDAACALVGQSHAWSSRRQAVINADEELQERELIKLARLAVAIAGALRERGAPEPGASLAAEAALAAFRVGFERWSGGPGEDDGLTAEVRAALDELRAVTAA